jgi:hypothetical protein
VFVLVLAGGEMLIVESLEARLIGSVHGTDLDGDAPPGIGHAGMVCQSRLVTCRVADSFNNASQARAPRDLKTTKRKRA